MTDLAEQPAAVRCGWCMGGQHRECTRRRDMSPPPRTCPCTDPAHKEVAP